MLDEECKGLDYSSIIHMHLVDKIYIISLINEATSIAL